MDPVHRERLRKNHVLLKDSLQVVPVLDHMFSKGIFSEDEEQDIRSRPTTPDKCHIFLDYLRRKGNEGYMTFCSVLKDLQPDILNTIENTKIDREIMGEESQTNIFFDPSEDFELKGLIDDLTKDNKISPDQLERMKNFVIGEPGCSEEIIEKMQTPSKLLRHLMKTRLLSRYNLTFLQSLLWRVDNKSLCRDVAYFARQCSHKPVHFYTPPKQAENGYTFGRFHIEGNVDHFKGITVEDICQRVARYLGVPASKVVTVGIEPSGSIILTLMIPVDAMDTLKSIQSWSWLFDLGVDYIQHDNGKIVLGDSPMDTQSEHQLLKRELKRRLETEQHLKQCLYVEQMSNENLKDLQEDLEQRLHRSEETTKELNTWYVRVFAVLLMSFHFIGELLKERMGIGWPGTEQLSQGLYNSQFLGALENAKKWSSNHNSLMKLVDATQQVERLKNKRDIKNMQLLTNASLVTLQQNLNEAVTIRMTERRLGHFKANPSLDEVRQANISFSVLCGLKRLQPQLEEILADLMNKLDDEQLQKVCRRFNVPRSLQTPELKSIIIIYIIFYELDKQGKQIVMFEETDVIIKECFIEAGRKDLWQEYQSTIKTMKQQQQEQRKAQSRKESDITDRLDRIEKMMQTVVGQTKMGSMGIRGLSTNGNIPNTDGFSGLLGEMMKGQTMTFQPFIQHQI